MSSCTVRVANELDAAELLTLMRAYCDNSDEPHVAKPSDADLMSLCQTILKDPTSRGVYLLARTAADNQAIGFASLFWSWTFLPRPSRQALLSDLYVCPRARNLGVARSLVEACVEQARARGDMRSIVWQTACENVAAQRVYERLGVRPTACVDYELVLFE